MNTYELVNYKLQNTAEGITPENKKRTEKCTSDFANRLTNNNIPYEQKKNQFIIQTLPGIIAVHCPSNENYDFLLVNKKTYENYPAGIYLGYHPDTLKPQGFAWRDDLFLMPEYNAYGIERAKLGELSYSPN